MLRLLRLLRKMLRLLWRGGIENALHIRVEGRLIDHHMALQAPDVRRAAGERAHLEA